jgi:hypothetical protein
MYTKYKVPHLFFLCLCVDFARGAEAQQLEPPLKIQAHCAEM